MSDWHTTQVGLPTNVTDIANSLDSVLDALITLLNTAKAILDIIKTFMIGTLDPVQMLLQQIITDIEGQLQDFDQIGIYYTGDFQDPTALVWPYESLQGGYPAYEQRMLARLLNRNDPTRPDFSASSEVIALFLYVSANPEGDVSPLLDLIEKVSKFLGQKSMRARPYPAPVPIDVRYGISTTGLGQWQSTSEVLETGVSPSVANLRWKLGTPVKDGQIRLPLPPPSGFLIEVSTVPDGLQINWDGPETNATKDTEGSQNRQDGLVLGPDQQPFVLYGGHGILTEDSSLSWTASGDTYTCPAIDSSGVVKDGAMRVYCSQSSVSNVPIPLAALTTSDGKPVLQRSFFYDSSVLLGFLFTPGHPFSYKLNQADMPYGASFTDAGNGKVTVTVDTEPARTVYARVRACTGKVAAGTGDLASTFSYALADTAVAGAQKSGMVLLRADNSQVSDPSTAIAITFPEASYLSFTDTLTVALVVMVLSRADLYPSGSVFQTGHGGAATGLESAARILMPKMGAFGKQPDRYFSHEGVGPSQFRKDVLIQSRALANDICMQLGTVPDSLLSTYTSAQFDTTYGGKQTLSSVKWSDLSKLGSTQTILDSLSVTDSIGGNPNQGIGLNPVSNGTMTPFVTKMLIASTNNVASLSLTLTREPGFISQGGTSIGSGSSDMSPVLYNLSSSSGTGHWGMDYCRNVFLNNQGMLDTAATVLQFAAATVSAPQTGAWLTYRLFPQGLPEIEAFFQLIEDFLAGLLTGTRDLTAMILTYIEFIEARILELEGLLQRIEALLDIVLTIQIPAASGLLVTGEGTMGIVSALSSAGNKPTDSGPSNIGGGVCLLAGGLPTPIVELFKLFFVQEGA